jgi:hypothetical protein
LYSAGLTYLGLRDLARHSIEQVVIASSSEAADDSMIAALHGDVNLATHSEQRRKVREEAAEERSESYDDFKRYVENLVP